MRIAILIFLAAMAIAGCSRMIFIRVSPEGGSMELEFFADNSRTTRQSPCVWEISITDENDKRAILRYENTRDCVQMNSFVLRDEDANFKVHGKIGDLREGGDYTVRVHANGASGQSRFIMPRQVEVQPGLQ